MLLLKDGLWILQGKQHRAYGDQTESEARHLGHSCVRHLGGKVIG